MLPSQSNQPRAARGPAGGRSFAWRRRGRRDLANRDFRSFIALCGFAGLRLGEAAAVRCALGHTSATVTLNPYAHLWPTAEDRTRAAAAAMLGQVVAPADEPLANDDAAQPADQLKQDPIRR
ncbi:hypothetical protein ACFQE5_06825 [Pseudonocardia hispaniensis]|uniref:Phage integrase family protein n=1 Tax=Pseudonocardia hispaniensis TaxID=904933 RepID=A0ABW1J0R1_9PSEU